MKYRIHYGLPDGSFDSIVIEGSYIEELQKKAAEEVSKRGGKDPWSEEIE